MWPPFASYSVTHPLRINKVVDCGLWNVVPLLFNGCAKLLDIGENWSTLLYKLCTDRALSCWNMRWLWRMNGKTMGLRISSRYLCAFKLPLIKCPTATMGHSVHNDDISKPLAHTSPYMLSAIYLVQLKLGFIHKEHTSPACQWPSKLSICTLKSVNLTALNCSQVKTLVRTTSTQMRIIQLHRYYFWWYRTVSFLTISQYNLC